MTFSPLTGGFFSASLLFTLLRTTTNTPLTNLTPGPCDLLSDKSLVKTGVVAATVCATPLLFTLANTVNWTQLAATAVGGHVLRKELTKLDY